MSRASGCPLRQDVPGVRIPGESCLASGRSRQDVLLRLKKGYPGAGGRVILAADPGRLELFEGLEFVVGSVDYTAHLSTIKNSLTRHTIVTVSIWWSRRQFFGFIYLTVLLISLYHP